MCGTTEMRSKSIPRVSEFKEAKLLEDVDGSASMKSNVIVTKRFRVLAMLNHGLT